MTHTLELDTCEDDTYWGFCSCGRWSGGPDSDSEEIVGGFAFHVAVANGERITAPDGWPEWDDPTDPDDVTPTMEEVTGCR